MLELSSKEDLARVLERIQDPTGYTGRVGLIVGGEDFSQRFLSGEWGQSEIPITLDATIAGLLPDRLDGAPLELYVQVEDVVVPQLFSAKMAFVASSSAGGGSADDWKDTDLLASTAGSLLNADDAIRLGRVDEDLYSGVPPEFVAWDVLSRAPYTGVVRVDPLGTPILAYAGAATGAGVTPAFAPQSKLGDALSQLQKDANYLFRDTVTNGHVAALPIQLGSNMSFAATYQATSFPQYNRPAAVYPRYFDVAVYTLNPDGSYAYDPVVVEVPYRGAVRRPYRGQTLWIHLDDETANAETNAAQLAYDTAELQARGLYSVPETALPAFNPLVEREDSLLVAETRKDEDGVLWDKRWAWKVSGYKQDYNSALLSTSVTATAIVLDEELIAVPALIVPGVSGGVVLTPGDPYGSGAGGFWFDPVSALDANGAPWIGLDGSGGWIDPALTDRVASDGAGFWFEWEGEPYGNNRAGVWYDPNLVEGPQGVPWVGLDGSGGWIDPALTDRVGEDISGFWFYF